MLSTQQRSISALVSHAIISLIIGSTVCPSAVALTLNGYDADEHERFNNSPDFIGNGLDFSGVGRAYLSGGSVQGPWATMISDTVFVTATHNDPYDTANEIGQYVRFHRYNDISGDYWEGKVLDYQRISINGSDLTIGRVLDRATETQAPPSWVERYPVLTRPSGVSHEELPGISDTAWIVGRASSINDPYMRVGRNTITPSVEGGVSWTYDPVGGLGDDEAQTIGGDSGAPSFFRLGNQLVLAGTHTGVNVDTAVQSLGRVAIQNAVSTLTGGVESPYFRTELPGDFNADYRVGNDDLNILLNNWGVSTGNSVYLPDVDQDGMVGSAELTELLNGWGKTLTVSSDFNKDFVLNTTEFNTIGANFLAAVSAGADGDATGDAYVDYQDLNALIRHWRYNDFVAPEPVFCDWDGDGIAISNDQIVLLTYWGQNVTPYTNGDATGDGYVGSDDLNAFLAAVVAPSSIADIDGNHQVDALDLSIIVDQWQLSVTPGASGDLDSDGLIGEDDLSMFATWWGQGVSTWQVAGQLSAPSLSIPEPSSFAIIVACALASIVAGNGVR